MRGKGGRGGGDVTMEDVGGRRTISSVLRGAISSLVVHSDGFWQDSDGTQPKGTIRKKIESSKHRNALLLS